MNTKNWEIKVKLERNLNVTIYGEVDGKPSNRPLSTILSSATIGYKEMMELAEMVANKANGMTDPKEAAKWLKLVAGQTINDYGTGLKLRDGTLKTTREMVEEILGIAKPVVRDYSNARGFVHPMS